MAVARFTALGDFWSTASTKTIEGVSVFPRRAGSIRRELAGDEDVRGLSGASLGVTVKDIRISLSW